MPKVIQVIENRETIGTGTDGDPIRTIIVYYNLDGTRLIPPEKESLPIKEQPPIVGSSPITPEIYNNQYDINLAVDNPQGVTGILNFT